MILALDIGTSSVRAALYNMRGDVLTPTMVKHERVLKIDDDGAAELDARTALAQLGAAIDEVFERAAGIKGEIIGVAISCFWHSLVGVNADNEPTTDVLVWADTRSHREVGELRQAFTESRVHNRTGARFHTSFWPAKLRWLRRHEANAFGKTRYWLALSDYLLASLLDSADGKPVTSFSTATASGLFNLRENCWDEELTAFAGISGDALPRLTADDETGILKSEFAARWPRLENARWFPAIGDGAANNVGAGCLAANRAALMIGTSGAMRVAYRGDVPTEIPPGLWCYRIDSKTVIIGGALSDGGGLYQWLRQNLQLRQTDDELEDLIAARAPAAHGLTFLPFLAGERSTGYHENAAGACLGLRAATDQVDIVQAALESVAYRFASIYDQLKKVTPITEVIASGGALRASPVWTQIIADTFGCDLCLPDTREASSRGAVLIALERLGEFSDIAELSPPSGTVFRADPDRHQIYRQARRTHEEFYELLIARLSDQSKME